MKEAEDSPGEMKEAEDSPGEMKEAEDSPGTDGKCAYPLAGLDDG